MKILNEMEIKFNAISENESFARACASGFCLGLNPSIEELTDIKTAVSEAVTNCIVHAYPQKTPQNKVSLKMTIYEDCSLYIEIKDEGIGIENISKAREPFFTTKPNDERSGMGFTVMESFMDEVVVESNSNKGTLVKMFKKINQNKLNIQKM